MSADVKVMVQCLEKSAVQHVEELQLCSNLQSTW